MPDFDLAIVGGGPGGYVAAIRAAQLGLRVALVEKGRVGGVCLNWGCIPSKTLLHAATLANQLRQASGWGITFDNLSLDLGVAVDRSRQAVEKIVSGVETLLAQNGVELITATASFENVKTLRLSPNGGRLEAENLIIATGGVLRTLPGVPPDGHRVLTSREALELRDVPASIAIIGGGSVGVEFAYLYRAYGAEVTLIEALPHLLPCEDEEVSRALERSFGEQGIVLRLGARVEGLTVSERDVRVRLADGGEEVVAERALVAVGVGANTAGLGLDRTGAALRDGFVAVDEHCRTNVEGVYAIGDVTGCLPLAHVASAQGVTAVESIAGLDPPPIDYSRMPRAVYCEPQVASVGLTEAEARGAGYEVRTGRFPFRANGKAIATDESEGMVKLVADSASDEILGYHVIGAGATELIGEASLGAVLETTPAEFAAAVFAHPTFSEAIKEAALAVSGESIHYFAPPRGQRKGR
jgi:dihydrolipoamide dehydrogenase